MAKMLGRTVRRCYRQRNAGSIDSAPEGSLEGDEAVLAVQKHAAQVLVFFLCDMELAELLDVGGTGECLGGA